MKNLYFKGLALILLLILVIALFPSEKKNSKQAIKLSEGKKEYPQEWMYWQRAYPDNYINRTAIAEAVTQTRSILESRNPEQGGNWNFIGPLNTGGRVTDVAISPDSDATMYVTTAVGGVFKTTDGGANWTPIFDAIGKPSIGNIAIAPSDAQRIYVGTGEANGSATSGAFYGDGIYRSDDAGTSWTNVGLDGTDHIGRIVVDPNNPDRVFVAATGTLYGYNEERGVYRTTNGGNDWERVLFVTDSTAAIDVVINPVNTDVLFAATWERTRKPWQRDYGGVTSLVHRSTDGGDTWTTLGASNGLPAPDEQTGRIGLAISESNPDVVYARYTTNEITNVFDAIYKTTDGGDNWTEINTGALSNIDFSFGWYFGNIRVNPQDENEVFVLGQTIARTSNSGGSWEFINGMHVDHHALEYSRNNPNFVLAGNDGGAYTSTNGGTTWTKFENLPITQFYNIEVDNSNPNALYGGTQDNNTIRTLTAGASDWNSIWGGDGFHVNVDYNNNNFVYVESQFGNLGRSINGGNTFVSALDGIDGNDRTNWNTPVIISPFDSEKVYYGSNRLYISDRAVFWTPISPDLTNGQHPSGATSYATLTAIAPSYNNLDVIYTGSDDGKVSVTFDGGTTWNTISDDLPNRYVTSIAISPSDDQTAYVTFSGYSELDYTPHVFKTTDGGENWTDISSNLPSIPVNDIIIKNDESLLFVATDLNVWVSEDDGAFWQIVGNNLPLTIIRDLKLHEPTNTLYAGTFGRSMHSFNLNGLVLDVDEVAEVEKNVILFPNPASEVINVKHTLTGQGSIAIYDTTGKLVQIAFEGDLASTQNTIIPVNRLATGLYIVHLKNKKQKITKRMVIK